MELPEVVDRICASFVHALNESAEGLLEGLYLRGSLAWGEFFDDSDIDFTAMLSRRPGPDDLAALEAAHAQVGHEVEHVSLQGHHVLLDDLRRAPDQCPEVPCATSGSLVPASRLDVNPWSWAELARHGVRVVGRDPRALGIHDDPLALRDFAAATMAGQWARMAKDLRLRWMVAGHQDRAVRWCTLGAAQVHHQLATGALTSSSGAGRYVLAELDESFHRIATEALRLREHPELPSAYRSASQRGKDLRDFLAFCVADAERLVRLPPPAGTQG